MTSPWPTESASILTPIKPGEEAALSTYLRAVPELNGPFSRLPSTHFARFVILGQIGSDYPGAPPVKRRLRMRYLLFTAVFNGALDTFLDQLWRQLPDEVNNVWSHCAGYPEPAGCAEFQRYMAHNALPYVEHFAAYDATVDQVHNAVDVRDRHIAFACKAQNLSDRELLTAFQTEFPG